MFKFGIDENGRRKMVRPKFKNSGRVAVIALSVAALVVSLLAFLLALVIWADPQLVPFIKNNYNDLDSHTKAVETTPSEVLEPEPEVKLNFGESAYPGRESRVYTFATTDRVSLLSQVGDDGEVEGFFVDVIRRLCEEAKKTCRFIIVKTYTTIWDGTTHMSEGLMRRFFDGGLIVSHTPTRAASYSFTEPILKRLPSVVYRKNGTSFTEQDMATKRIGVIDGWFTTIKCLEKGSGKTIPPENVVVFPNTDAVLAAFEEDKIDLAFLIPLKMFQVKLEEISSYDSCSNGPVSVIVRKDSPVQVWMSDVTRKMKEAGKFEQMCHDLQKRYQGEIFNCTENTPV